MKIIKTDYYNPIEKSKYTNIFVIKHIEYQPEHWYDVSVTSKQSLHSNITGQQK